jgi:DNA-binding GntR family transcriptional regulator
MGFQPAVSLTEQIAEHLGRQIITGQLQPSDRIQELRVAAELGVSRGSVREALLILESRHLIEIVPRRGAVVSRLEAAEITNFSELYTDLLDSFFCKLAAQDTHHLKGAGTLAGLAEALAEIVRGVEEADIDGVLGARRDFIEAGLDGLDDNYYLKAVLGGLVPAGLRLAHLVACHPDFDPRDTLRYHQALLAAIRQADAVQVGQMVNAFGRREGRLAIASLALKPAQTTSVELSGALPAQRRHAL